MNYLKIYEQLIESARCNTGSGEYKELHHIVPLCIGGSNDNSNKVLLSARQHFIAHWLLYKAYKTSSLVHAWHSMCRIGRGQEARRINSRYFKYAKEQRAAVLSKTKVGSNNHFFGKKHTDESRMKMSKKQLELKMWERFTSDHKLKLHASQKKPKTNEHKQKIGRKGMVNIQNINTHEIIRVLVTDERRLSSDWVNPRRLAPEKKRKCKYCEIVSIPANIKRWHDEKCKQRKYNED